jgi:hypothetical protein
VPDTETQTHSSTLHIAQTDGGGAKRSIPCRVERFQGNRLRILTSEGVATGTAVSVEHEDALLLGEVAHEVEQSASWALEIRVEQMLNGLMSLMALRARLLEEAPAPAEASVGSSPGKLISQ